MMDTATRDLVRERGLELLVSIEYLPAFRTAQGTTAFGVLCEMVGKCLQHVAMGRYAEALMLAARVGRPVLEAVRDPEQHKPFKEAYEGFVGSIEGIQGAGSTTLH